MTERTSRALGFALQSDQVLRLQDWRDRRFAGRPWLAAGVVLVPMAIFAVIVVAVDSSILILPSAWLLLVALAALLGGWRIGVAMTLIGAVALAMVVAANAPACRRRRAPPDALRHHDRSPPAARRCVPTPAPS